MLVYVAFLLVLFSGQSTPCHNKEECNHSGVGCSNGFQVDCVGHQCTCVQNHHHEEVHKCNKSKVIEAILIGHPLHVPHIDCVHHQLTTHSLVYNYCGNNSTTSWKRGQRVEDYCNAHPHVTDEYKPISTFHGHDFHGDSGITAIFLSCESNGIKIATELCNNPPLIYSLGDHPLTNHLPAAHDFYFIAW
ncbi:uncharacterized protein LOC134271073 isoform X2 [Saccostrea cucullata]|uniref:uncharacterized protein LOC134271073 isoform X2 n=1 Tax=Saccostrea cuccullata TaxID=36930 RepID=UPI002ED07651